MAVHGGPHWKVWYLSVCAVFERRIEPRSASGGNGAGEDRMKALEDSLTALLKLMHERLPPPAPCM